MSRDRDGVAAAQKALAHSGLGAERNPERCGCLFGCDYILTRPEEFADGMRNVREAKGGRFDVADWPQFGLPKVNPLWLLKYLPNMPNSHVSIYNDFRGPNNSLTVREASSNLSLAEAASIIQRGRRRNASGGYRDAHPSIESGAYGAVRGFGQPEKRPHGDVSTVRLQQRRHGFGRRSWSVDARVLRARPTAWSEDLG
ncbi:MAG: beta-ketoacyl synthase N-terminal-like domain-containing protein [Pirellulaceae bacterium]